MQSETREFIESILRDNRVVLFMKGNRAQPQCGFSARTVAALDMLLPDYLSIDVLQSQEIREGIKAYGNWPTIPQLYVDGELVGGCDIITEMFASGELADALGVTPPGDALPAITIEPAAAKVMAEAVTGNPGAAVQLKIDAGFGHQLSLAPPRPGLLAVPCGGVTLHMDPWTAARAEGLGIRLVESLQGTGFAFDNPKAPPPVKSLGVRELKAALDAGKAPRLYDVRGEDERAVAAIPGARPWDEAAQREIDGLPKDTPLAFACHKGGRSRAAAERYRRRGYTNLWNVEGGVDAWSTDVDPSVARY